MALIPDPGLNSNVIINGQLGFNTINNFHNNYDVYIVIEENSDVRVSTY